MQKYSDVVLDKNGKPIASAIITAITYPDGLAATIYAADGGPAVPYVTTDSNGRFAFYAANGHYSITVTGSGITPASYNDILLYDPSSSQNGLLIVGNGPVANMATGDNRHLLELVNDNSAYQCLSMSAYGASTNGNNIHFNRYFGTLAAPAVITNGAFFKSEGYRGWDGSGSLSQSMAAHQVMATQDWSPGSHGIKFHWEVAKAGTANRYPAMDLYSGASDSVVLQLGDGSSLLARLISSSNTGAMQIHGSYDQNGAQSIWYGSTHATAPSEMLHRANRTTWQSVGGSEFMRVTSSGIAIGKGGDASYALEVKSFGANAFNVTAAGVGGAMFYSTNGNGTFVAGENAAAAALYVRKDSATGRSINAAGLISASGADLAERMANAIDCGAIAAGQIVGVNSTGELTDKWAASISFLIKSTAPSFVGNDVLGDDSTLIAYCGQVPVNVRGAVPGQYVVPVQDGDGIGSVLVDDAAITFEQYRRAVGIVQNILPDGRANVRVKVA